MKASSHPPQDEPRGNLPPELARFGPLLRRWRLSHGHKLATAAAELGVCTATWGHWECGTRFPSAGALASLSQYTGIPVRCLVCEECEGCGHCGGWRPGPTE